MKKTSIKMGILTMALLALTTISCKDGKKEETPIPMSSEMPLGDRNESGDSERLMANDSGNSSSEAIIDNYLKIKNALVADNQEEAAKAGGVLVANFEDFDTSGYSSEEQQELKDIIEDAKEHAEHISESPMEHQREHFGILSKDVIDMIAITGTDKKLYQDFCPMYNNKKGAQWLSSTEEIKNPFFGSKMMNCGEVQKQIN